MKLKDLEKIKLIETALMLGVPIGLSLFNHNPDSANQSTNWVDQLFNNTHNIYATLASIPRLADAMLTTRIELKTEDYKEIKDVYYQVVHNFSLFLEKQKMEDPVAIFAIYQYMYRNGYLSFNHHFNYDVDMKDLSKLNGVDIVRGTGVCRSIGSFLTDVYKDMGYDACNLLVNANRKVLDNIDRQGNYPKWKISKKTNMFVKTVSKVTDIVPLSNHLISCVEKDNKVYVFDPTNDGFLIKGKHNRLVLPDGKDGVMKLSYVMNTLQDVVAGIGNLNSGISISQKLNKPTIEYEEYKELYQNTLTFIRNNMEIFDQFYENNQSLYIDLYEKLNGQSNLIRRFVPELNITKLFDYISSLDEKHKNR